MKHESQHVIHPSAFSLRRLKALCRKETLQIMRDPSSIAIAVILPIVLLLIFGFGINLDTNRLRMGIVIEDSGKHTQRLVDEIVGSPYIDPYISHSRIQTQQKIDNGELRGMIVIPSDFSAKVSQGNGEASIQVVSDGSQPNVASFVVTYAQGIWQSWQMATLEDAARQTVMPVDLQMRYWFNPTVESRNYLVPGIISIILTIIGALLTSMVIAREWERGTMEALLSTPVKRTEFLLSKVLPYYVLGMVSMLICVLMATLLMHVPMRGSLLVLFVTSSLFLGSALGMGLLISTVTRKQFNAAVAAINAAFLPAVLLSGFMFEIASMPTFVQVLTYILPGRYYVAVMQTLFQAGEIWYVIGINSLFLFFSALFWLGLTARKTRRRLDE